MTKTYSLTQGDYHVGLEVKVKRWRRRAGRQGRSLPLPADRRPRPAGRGPLVHQHLPQCADRPGGRTSPICYRGVVPRLSGPATDLQLGGRQRGGPASRATSSATPAWRCSTSPRPSWWTTSRPTARRPETSLAQRPADAGNSRRQGRRQERGRGRKSFVLTRAADGRNRLFTSATGSPRRAAAAGRGRSQIEGRFLPPCRTSRACPWPSSTPPAAFRGATEEPRPVVRAELRNDAVTQPLWEDDVTVRVSHGAGRR